MKRIYNKIFYLRKYFLQNSITLFQHELLGIVFHHSRKFSSNVHRNFKTDYDEERVYKYAGNINSHSCRTILKFAHQTDMNKV